ncbi:TPA: hypothetical protein ACGOON_001330 [Streptococcus suis]
MNNKDWVEYFEVINGRKPTAAEYEAALKSGEFEADVQKVEQSTPVPESKDLQSPTSPPLLTKKPKFFTKYKIAIIAFLTLLVSGGAYFAYQYYQEQQNSLDGVWVLTKYATGESDSGETQWHENSDGIKYYVEVKDNKMEYYVYSDYNDYTGLDLHLTFQVDTKNQTLVFLTTEKEFAKYVLALYGMTEDEAGEEYKEVLLRTNTYEKNEDTFTWTTYYGNESWTKHVYRKLSPEEAEEAYQLIEELK